MTGKKPPPPEVEEKLPEEVVLRVPMHCEACARSIRRSLRGLQGIFREIVDKLCILYMMPVGRCFAGEGVEEVRTDIHAGTVVVVGRAAAARPEIVLERVRRKKGKKKVELVSPLPTSPPAKLLEATADAAKVESEESKVRPPEGKKAMVVVIDLDMHCEACAREMKRRILKLDGVHTVEVNLAASRATVKGTVDPATIVDFVERRTGRRTVIVSAEAEATPPQPKEAAEKGEAGATEKKKKKDGGKVNKDDGGDHLPAAAAAPPEYIYCPYPSPATYPPPYYYYPCEYSYYPRAPATFSDENPNACAVM